MLGMTKGLLLGMLIRIYIGNRMVSWDLEMGETFQYFLLFIQLMQLLNVAVFYRLQSMAHGLSWLSGERAYVSRVGRDRLLFRRRALLSMLSCRVGTPDPISVRPPPASSPPRPIKLFAFVKFLSLIVAFDCLKNILVVVYIRGSCCWLFETV